jgi:hypothetical protein
VSDRAGRLRRPTLFQPERAALRGTLPPLVAAFAAACARRARASREEEVVG